MASTRPEPPAFDLPSASGPVSGHRRKLLPIDRGRPVDVALKVVTTAADHGRLWLGLAAVGAVVGSDYRRAAIRGVGSLALASFAANAVLKPLAGRRRPNPDHTDPVRRIGGTPWTSSFPSGHAASAAAFAAGAAMEAPAAAALLGPLAAVVGYSRVHVGVHYPSDVFVGAGVGIGAALAVRRLWPVRRGGPAELAPATVAALPGGRGLTVVVNRASGSAADAADQISRLLPQARIVQWDPEDGPDALAPITDDALAIGVAGGDGTCAAVAGVALDHGLPLAVFAAGTFNHFAKALGLDSYQATAAAVEAGTGGAADVARIDGKPFLNTAAVGIYPEFVAERDRLAGRLGKPLAAAVALPRTFLRAAPARLTINGTPTAAWTVFVGNGHYSPRGLVSSSRDHLADGLLDVQVIHQRGRLSRVRATFFSLIGQVEKSGVYSSLHTRVLDISVTTDDLRIAHDGEISDPVAQLRLDLNPSRLAVYRGAAPRTRRSGQR